MKILNTTTLLIAAILATACSKEPEKPADSSAEDVKAIREMMEREQAIAELSDQSTKINSELLLCASKVRPGGDSSVCDPLHRQLEQVDAELKRLREQPKN